MTKKYDENILVFPTSLLARLPKIIGGVEKCLGEGETWVSVILDHAHFLDRNLVETDPTYKQIIPYVVVRHVDEKGEAKYLTYGRGKSGGEARLHAMHSIGVGGHVNDSEGEEPGFALYSSILRELDEEFELDYNLTSLSPYPLAIINDDSDDVGKVHFGMVFMVDALSTNVKAKEASQEKPKFLSIGELGDLELENWSDLVRMWVL